MFYTYNLHHKVCFDVHINNVILMRISEYYQEYYRL